MPDGNGAREGGGGTFVTAALVAQYHVPYGRGLGSPVLEVLTKTPPSPRLTIYGMMT